MRVAVAYVYPAVNQVVYRPLARRFADTYMANPPGSVDHDVYTIINGGTHQMAKNYQAAMSPLPVKLFFHNNVGKDIGGFQALAADPSFNYDLMVCLGAPVRCRRAGWLDRIVQAYEQNGPGLYGAWAFHQPMEHVRTTAFWLPPQLLNAYPYQVVDGTRYEFEHGHRSIHQFTKSVGLGTYMVTWNGCYGVNEWHHIGLEDSLFIDQHMEMAGMA